MQAGHFGLAPFDPVGLTTDYNRQAEVCFRFRDLPMHAGCDLTISSRMRGEFIQP
jgi:hypothetical protein